MNEFLQPSNSDSASSILSKRRAGEKPDEDQPVGALITEKQTDFVVGAVAGVSPSSVVSDSVLATAATSAEDHKLSYENEKSHHGSTTSTTFSTGSTMSSTTNDPVDYSSTASSGVGATMSSNDHLPPQPSSSSSKHNSSNSTTSDDLANSTDVSRNLLKASTSTPQTAVVYLSSSSAAGNGASSSSTLSLNTAADSTLGSARNNFLRSASPNNISNLSAPGIARSASNKSIDGFFLSSNFGDENQGIIRPSKSSPGKRNEQTDMPSSNKPSNAIGIAGCATSSSPSCSLMSTSPFPPNSSVFACGTSCSQIICTPLRTMVSQNRRRYQQDGFNLDLTYITDRIIAMGYPADTTEALYRNSMTHIVKFLEHYHPGHYKVFNLRGQYVYDTTKFHNRVVSFEMTDHHPPRLELMAPFCREVHEYLEADPKNVVAVHCKAGKGRTGVMICAYLTYISFYKTPRQNMDYYSIVRTHNNKGVTIPSQRRYVYYFSHLRNKKLNYMPLRTELIGVYVEKPPNFLCGKLGGPFLKGALKVRVANGDVDVFLGDDLWLSADKSEEEDEMHRRHPIMTGEDQYDPNHPQGGKDCISRRCYGWTVPSNKRVFLEGDVRIDLFQKSQLKVLNVKQEKKKIGHIWMNTMFCCPGFCGGQYVHGDEAYPYPNGESMIVRRRLRRKTTKAEAESLQKPEAEMPGSANSAPTNSFSMPSSPPSNKFHNKVRISVDNTSTNSTESAPSSQNDDNGHILGSNNNSWKPSAFDPRRASKIALRLNGITKKRSGRSPVHHIIEAEKGEKCWMSQDGDLGPSSKHKNSCKETGTIRSSLDNDNEYEEEIIVEPPPGLDQHCPMESLKDIYQSEKHAPRHGIVDILRVAYQKNLIHDLYNARRFSVPKEGSVMPKAPLGRPNADGPYCVMREKEEHVSIFGVQEIDRAHKGKDLDMSFKVYIVTRCINEANPADVQLAMSFLRTTYHKQKKKDEVKKEKVELRQKKLIQSQGCAIYSNAALSSDGDFGGNTTAGNNSNGFTDSSSSSSQFSSIPDLSPQSFQSFNHDPRLSDPHLKKFFFRQRVSSQSRHPNLHYHCPSQNQDPSVCEKYYCSKRRHRHSVNNKNSSITDRPTLRSFPPLYVDNEADVEDDPQDLQASCFDDFDFFHPAAFDEFEDEANLSSEGSSVTRTPVDMNTLNAIVHARSATMTSATVDCKEAVETIKQSQRSRSARSAIAVEKQQNKKELMPNAVPDLNEATHPSDCSWASSSSSTSSSSHSLTYPSEQVNPPANKDYVQQTESSRSTLANR